MNEKALINKNKIFSSLRWKFFEKNGVQIISLVVQIILARLLTPTEFGIVALLAIFINISDVFINYGFNIALIQKKDTDKIDYSTVLYISLSVAASCYALLFYAAPSIARFYSLPELTDILRVIALVLFPGVFNSIQNSIISRQLDFKKSFIANFFALGISGALGIIMAYLGFGVWALVAQQLSSAFAICLIMWFTVKWRPQIIFSWARAKSLFSFGWKILTAVLLDVAERESAGLIIGKMFSPAALAFYSKGKQFPSIVSTGIDGAIQSVLLPVYSKLQDDKEKLKSTVRRSITLTSFVNMPIMFCLAAAAEPLVRVLLTEKWLPCVPIMQIFCISASFYPIATNNTQVMNAMGRSDIFLKIEIIKKLFWLIILAVFIPYGIYAFASGMLLFGIICNIINTWPNKKLLDYGPVEQFKDILQPILISTFTALIVWSLLLLKFNIWLTLLLQPLTAIIIYISLSWLAKSESLQYLWENAKIEISAKK
jgi:teichuronic acid exporter